MSVSSKIRVVIVDDEPEIREVVADAFESAQAQVFQAGNATDGMLAVKDQTPDILVSDIRMPGGASGFDLLKAVRTISKEKPIVALMSGFSDIPLTDMYEEGACAVFNKPFDRNALVQTMLSKLESPEKRWSQKPADPTGQKIDKNFSSLKEAEENRIFKLGQGGFFIHINNANYERNTSVHFKLQFRDSKLANLEGRGIIRWIRRAPADQLKTGYGIEILFLEENCRNQAIHLITESKFKAYIPNG